MVTVDERIYSCMAVKMSRTQRKRGSIRSLCPKYAHFSLLTIPDSVTKNRKRQLPVSLCLMKLKYRRFIQWRALFAGWMRGPSPAITFQLITWCRLAGTSAVHYFYSILSIWINGLLLLCYSRLKISLNIRSRCLRKRIQALEMLRLMPWFSSLIRLSRHKQIKKM